MIERSFSVKWQTHKIIGESFPFEINTIRDEWALPFFFYGVFMWSLPENDGGGGAMAVEGDERVIAYEKKKKKKEKSKWVTGHESEDSCEMCGWGGVG